MAASSLPRRPPKTQPELLTSGWPQPRRTGSRRRRDLMTDRRVESRGQERTGLTRSDAEMATDLEALRRESAHNLPSIESIVRTATRRPRTWEEYLMATFGFLRRRPWVSTALAGALAAIALLVVPFSYERIT